MSVQGKKGLIVGIANEHSIAYGCARVLRDAGAELAITYLNAQAEPYVRPLAMQFDSPIIVPCYVRARPFFPVSAISGATSTSCSIPSPTRRKKICIAGSPTAHRLDLHWQWMCLAILSSGWRGRVTATRIKLPPLTVPFVGSYATQPAPGR
jgi:hypothetical protein